MVQSRTHNCGELRIENVGQKVTIVGWMENVRDVGATLSFVIVRDFYGTTQVVVENNEAVMSVIKGLNCESTISVTGVVRERSSKNPKIPTGEIEIVPESVEVLGKCLYNLLGHAPRRGRVGRGHRAGLRLHRLRRAHPQLDRQGER
ncbi:MAG: hypothetical protein IJJ23_07850, partial [Clostridia bacterium]|nr:hypothetical protein [Clostridia bacterium]